MEELDGERLRAWREPAEEEEAEVDAEKVDLKLKQETEKEWKEKYGDGPVRDGENPELLAMVIEGGEVEFEVI